MMYQVGLEYSGTKYYFLFRSNMGESIMRRRWTQGALSSDASRAAAIRRYCDSGFVLPSGRGHIILIGVRLTNGVCVAPTINSITTWTTNSASTSGVDCGVLDENTIRLAVQNLRDMPPSTGAYVVHPNALRQIADAMTAPIRQSLDYQGIARRLVDTEPISSLPVPIYDVDVTPPLRRRRVRRRRTLGGRAI